MTVQDFTPEEAALWVEQEFAKHQTPESASERIASEERMAAMFGSTGDRFPNSTQAHSTLMARLQEIADPMAVDVARYVDRWNGATTITRTYLRETSPLAFEVTDAEREGMPIATITYSEGGECWSVALRVGQYRDPMNRDDTPGDRAYRDFMGAVAYAEAWAWEVDGDLD